MILQGLRQQLKQQQQKSFFLTSLSTNNAFMYKYVYINNNFKGKKVRIFINAKIRCQLFLSLSCSSLYILITSHFLFCLWRSILLCYKMHMRKKLIKYKECDKHTIFLFPSPSLSLSFLLFGIHFIIHNE
jgi:hypothetical protein